MSVLVAVASTAAPAVAQGPSKPDTASAKVPDIPVLPDLVTAVPFTMDGSDHILVQAEVDGLSGTFSFDTGSPVAIMDRQYLPGDMNAGHPIIQTLHIGTLLQHLPAAGIGTPHQFPSNVIVRSGWRTIGLNEMEPFETIIDYVHHRLILIRLDSAGRRLAAVPAFTPRSTVRLVPATTGEHWAVEGQMGGLLDTLLIDTGNGVNELTAATREKLTTHLAPAGQDPMFHVPRWTLDHLVVAGQSFDASLFDKGDDDRTFDILGPPFLEQFGAVGFNFRTRVLILYKK